MDLSQLEFNYGNGSKSNQMAELSFASDEIKLLYDMVPTIGSIHNTIQPGSIVAMDREVFFVSTSIEEFEAEGMKFFGLSTESPLFKAMEGKKRAIVFHIIMATIALRRSSDVLSSEMLCYRTENVLKQGVFLR